MFPLIFAPFRSRSLHFFFSRLRPSVRQNQIKIMLDFIMNFITKPRTSYTFCYDWMCNVYHLHRRQLNSEKCSGLATVSIERLHERQKKSHMTDEIIVFRCRSDALFWNRCDVPAVPSCVSCSTSGIRSSCPLACRTCSTSPLCHTRYMGPPRDRRLSQ